MQFKHLPSRAKWFSLLTVVVLTLSGCLGGDGAGKNLAPTPVITIEGESNIIDYGRPVYLSGENSEDRDGTIVKYIWDFGDGETETTDDTDIDHAYDLPGTYLISLTVEDNDGAQANNDFYLTSVDMLQAQVDEEVDSVPLALVVAKPSVARVDESVVLNAAGSWAWVDGGDGTPVRDTEAITSYEWDFADGGDANGAVVVHTFDTPGTYPVMLTLTSDGGLTEYIHSIRVLAKPTPSKNVKSPDTFTTVSIGEPEWLDPAHSYETAGGEVIENVYETLVYYDGSRHDKLIPRLATEVPTLDNGGISDDGLTYTFNLRTDVDFHETKYHMTAEDAAFSLHRLIEMDLPDGPSDLISQVLNTTGIETIGDYTLRLTLERPYSAFIYIMAYTATSVVSKDYVNGHGGVVPGERNEWMDENAMGTGPYKLRSWEKGEHIILERFDDYWGGWEGKHVRTVVLKKDTERTSRELALLDGVADVAYIPVTYRGNVEGLDDIRILEKQLSFRMSFIGFNLNIHDHSGTAPSAEFFNNTDLRQAFCYAFDYDQFVNDIMLGSGMQARGPIPKGMLGYDDNARMYDFDLDKAEDLFKEAGVWDSGFELTTYYNTGNTIREDGLLLLENTLETLNPNFEITVQGLEWTNYLKKFQNKELSLFFLGWAPDYPDPDNYVHPFFHSQGHYPNFLSYNNPVMDELIEEASRELDPNYRESLYSDIQELAYDEALFIWIAQAYTFHVERSWVQGYQYNPMYAGMYYYDLWKE